MPNDTVDLLQEELTAQVETIAPLIEGMRDRERALNKEDETALRASVHAYIDALQSRLNIIDKNQKALTELDANGFDQIPDLVLPEEQFAIWQRNEAEADAANARTKALPPPASSGTFTLTEGEDKPVPPSPPAP